MITIETSDQKNLFHEEIKIENENNVFFFCLHVFPFEKKILRIQMTTKSLKLAIQNEFFLEIRIMFPFRAIVNNIIQNLHREKRWSRMSTNAMACSRSLRQRKLTYSCSLAK